ncbi:MAG: MaoC family dehydratase N-terminal domain-containing protein [Chloroflexaceae bacterium]|jgi:acyl dehydratase|nr:MaoC family dehydratase N-terminal domain-containing protein [Chloroflexaceae bacterium]
MIDTEHIGRTFGPYQFEVERGTIRALATVVGDPNPLYQDVAAAVAAGYPDLAAPPTLPTRFSLWANAALLAELEQLGAPLIGMLHGEQEYSYHTPLVPGDRINAETRIAELKAKQGSSGPFQLITLETHYTNQRGELAVTERMVVVLKG